MEQKEPWYDIKAAVIIALIVFPPLGIYALVKNSTIKRDTKWALGGVFCVLFGVLVYFSPEDTATPSSSPSAEATSNKDQGVTLIVTADTPKLLKLISNAPVKHVRQTKAGYVGCLSDDLLDKYTSAVVAKEYQLTSYYESHGCIRMKAGLTASVRSGGGLGVTHFVVVANGQPVDLYAPTEALASVGIKQIDKPDYVPDYATESDELEPPYKRVVSVLLKQRIDEGSLYNLAWYIKALTPDNIERTFINFQVEQNPPSVGYWATAAFTPETSYGDVKVLDTTVEEQAKLDAHPTAPEQFPTLQAMFEEFGDFTGTGVQIVSERPAVIKLHPIVVPNDLDEVKQEETQRALIYGIYNTFIHTDLPSIDVTASPWQVTSLLHREEGTELTNYLVHVKVTREQALRVIQQFLPIRTFADLTQPLYDMHVWTKAFNHVYYKQHDALVADLMAESSGA